MTRPPPIRLDDLAHPTFPPHVVDIRAGMAGAAAEIALDADALMERARAETGLADFGNLAFAGRLRILLRALETEGRLSTVGRVMAHAQMLQLLRNRLLLENLLRRHPEIDAVPLRAPIFIVGLPRTGTTHLHNLMAADPALRSLPYWESLEPVLRDDERPAPGEDDPRRARCDQALWFVNESLPYFVRMHEMTTDHVHEEIQLLAIDFSTMLFETMGLLPSWRDAYAATDQTPAYGYLARTLKALQWLRGGTRWVLKSPQHLEQIGPLVRTFPDAVVVFTHRDPASVVASYLTMAAYTARMHLEPPIDLRAYGRYWRARIEDLFRACVRDRHLVSPERSLDVRFDEFMRDDLAMVRRIYALAGQPLTAEGRAAMDAFMATHPRGVHGTVEYDLAQFGLDADEIRRACGFYTERFGIASEARL
ncbi:MAG TPA: sulfotransferase [Candidatus Eisenbacteria bacterium]|nr:sulfotransferase [Candidatus Eisenbacteria bacterium]